MFYCKRCGAGFNAAAAPDAMACPRCRTKDGVFSPLTFERPDPEVMRTSRGRGLRDLAGDGKEAAGEPSSEAA